MAPEKILTDCLDQLAGTVLIDSYGERALYYNPGRKLKRGVYILTIKEKDDPNDKSSRLDREKVYRLNIGIRKSTFLKLFGALPNRPGKVKPSAWMSTSRFRTAYYPIPYTHGWAGYAY